MGSGLSARLKWRQFPLDALPPGFLNDPTRGTRMPRTARAKKKTKVKPVLLSVVAPCYNEELSLSHFVERTSKACRKEVGNAFEIVLINDGSKDRTWQVMLELGAEASNRIVAVNLNRNYGHQLALSAGLTVAKGERILIIDADLQDPPELLGEMMPMMDQGYNVVYGQRRKRHGESWLKLFTARQFYATIRRLTQIDIPQDTGDFRLMDRQTLNVLNSMPEYQRFIRGMVAWIGGKQIALPYDRDPRFAGETNYTYRKMIRFATDGITAFSSAPLRLASWFAVTAIIFAILLMGYTAYSYFFLGPVPGWTSLFMLVLVMSAAQLISLGIIGEYIGRLYEQSKGRPKFVIRDIVSDMAIDRPDRTQSK